MSGNMECPYCEKYFDYCDDEPGHGMEEAQCPKCEKNFVFERDYSVYYHTSKADCLNGAPHAWKKCSYYEYNGRHQWHCRPCDKRVYRPIGETP